MEQVASPRFVMEATEAESMAQSSNMSLAQLLPTLVKSAQSLARAPISNFPVAAVGVGVSGRVFVGVNLEFPGLPFHHTVHAEQFLLTNLSLHGETGLQCVAVSAAPCGHCRQFLQEIRGASDIPLLVTSESHNYQFTPLSQFLSHPFGPHDLLPKDVPLLLEPHHNALSFLNDGDSDSSSPDNNDNNNNNNNNNNNGVSNGYYGNGNKLKDAALEAANKSHAPYSGSHSGVALLDSRADIYTGSYIESAAYNPSLGPLQAALVAFLAGAGAGAGADYSDVVEAVLVEKEGAVVRQEHTARLLLGSISPHCHFHTFLCTSATP